MSWQRSIMEDKAKCSYPLYWHNCYSQNYDVWCPDAYQHPAKMSVGLAFRIMEHLKELSLLKEEDTILDPMSGISTTGIVASALGHRFIGVELEEKFIELSKKNKEYAERKLYKGFDWQLIKGDSRNLSSLLTGNALQSITSPPYGDQVIKDGQRLASNPDIHWREWDRGTKYNLDNPDNIGNLKDTPLKVIVSPPYGETGVGDWKTGRAEFQAWVINELKTKGYVEWQGKRYNEAEWRAMNHGRIDGRTTKGVHKHPTDGYSDNHDNIENMSDKPLKSVMSPPYEGGGHHKGMLDSWGGANTPVSDKTKEDHGYGNTEGQVEKAESYLSAMQKVYSEIALVSDVLCVVVKCPTRGGKLRRLDLDTISILEANNWKIHCIHRALLFEELEQANMFDGTTKKVKGRLSFFKRLSYIKGQPVASWEDIIVAVRK